MSKQPIRIHEDKTPGLVTNKVRIEPRENHGIPCFIAIERVSSILGHEVDGCELTGIGRTKEQAMARLEEERKKFYESLWA